MASKHRNMFHKKQETTEIGTRNLPKKWTQPAGGIRTLSNVIDEVHVLHDPEVLLVDYHAKRPGSDSPRDVEPLEPPCNPQKRLYGRRASSLGKWRRNEWWSHDVPDRKSCVTALGNGAIAAEATPNHLTTHDLNDARYESLATQKIPHTGQVVRMHALAPDLLIVNVSEILMCYWWTGTDLVFVDGVYAVWSDDPPPVRRLELKSWNSRDLSHFPNVQIVEIEAHALLSANIIAFSRYLEYLPAFIWDLSLCKVVGEVSAVVGSREFPYSIYGDTRGRIYVCYDGLISVHDASGDEVRRLTAEADFDVGDVQLQFNDLPVVMATVVNVNEVEAMVVAWDVAPDGGFQRIGTPVELESAALRALHPSRRALIFERRLLDQTEEEDEGVPDLCSIVAVDLRSRDVLWETNDLLDCPLWDDPFYLVDGRFVVLQLRSFGRPPVLRLVDVEDGTVVTNTLGEDLESIVHFGGKFVYCRTTQGAYRYIVFT
ncbi:hypothetical protein AAG570_007078 [Ranatra chinensis]|uniref:DUF1618 domain-containing protein n=1 Tax=Ranatra chinensis TaxID=642074 RepID=A0ABD0XW20_9HEMI